MLRFVTVSLFIFLPLLAADQVVLTNGDIITGKIVKKDGAKLTVHSDLLGAVSMPWSAVKTIRAESDVFVELPSGETVEGTLATAGDQLQVSTAEGAKSAPLAQVTTLRDAAEQHTFERLNHPGLLELWAGNFDLGLALASGNSRTETLTTAFTAARNTRADKVALYFNQIYGTARVSGLTSSIASAVRGGWKYNRNITPRFFVSAQNDYEHDGFQNLDLRFVSGLGVGWKAVNREGLSLDFDAGGDYNRENYIDGLHRNVAEAAFGNSLSYHLSRVTSLTQGLHFFTNLSDTGQYRMNFDLGTVTAVRKWLGFHITASERYISNPVQGRQRNDLLLSTGFRLTFAR